LRNGQPAFDEDRRRFGDAVSVSEFAPVRRSVSPTPSWPWLLIPQQYAAPPPSSPQPTLAPTVIDVNGRGAATATGTVR
jgi:hypothetical protein